RIYANVYKRRGWLRQKPCTCGNPFTVMHHADYTRPLDVEWLCRRCHRERHEGKSPRAALEPVRPVEIQAVLPVSLVEHGPPMPVPPPQPPTPAEYEAKYGVRARSALYHAARRRSVTRDTF